MAKFIVKVIALSLLSNQIAKFGDEVDEDQLANPPKKLVEEGYIVAVQDTADDSKNDQGNADANAGGIDNTGADQNTGSTGTEGDSGSTGNTDAGAGPSLKKK